MTGRPNLQAAKSLFLRKFQEACGVLARRILRVRFENFDVEN